jgi:hypothetical protein
LLVDHVHPVCSLLAPRHPGAVALSVLRRIPFPGAWSRHLLRAFDGACREWFEDPAE